MPFSLFLHWTDLTFSCSRSSHYKNRVSHCQQLLQLGHLKVEMVKRNRGGEDLQLRGIYIQNHEMLKHLNISHMIRHTYLEYEVLLWLQVEFRD